MALLRLARWAPDANQLLDDEGTLAIGEDRYPPNQTVTACAAVFSLAWISTRKRRGPVASLVGVRGWRHA